MALHEDLCAVVLPCVEALHAMSLCGVVPQCVADQWDPQGVCPCVVVVALKEAAVPKEVVAHLVDTNEEADIINEVNYLLYLLFNKSCYFI